jgi:hypothetical protein
VIEAVVQLFLDDVAEEVADLLEPRGLDGLLSMRTRMVRSKAWRNSGSPVLGT